MEYVIKKIGEEVILYSQILVQPSATVNCSQTFNIVTERRIETEDRQDSWSDR